jgi:hypothetical protein
MKALNNGSLSVAHREFAQKRGPPEHGNGCRSGSPGNPVTSLSPNGIRRLRSSRRGHVLVYAQNSPRLHDWLRFRVLSQLNSCRATARSERLGLFVAIYFFFTPSPT